MTVEQIMALLQLLADLRVQVGSLLIEKADLQKENAILREELESRDKDV